MREVGIAHSEGTGVIFSASPNRIFGTLAKEGGVTTKTPEQISRLIRDRRTTNESRRFMVVVEGSLEWLREYQRGVEGADFVYCSDEATLRAHGVEVLDAGWDRRQQLPPIDQLLLDKPSKSRAAGKLAVAVLGAFAGAAEERRARRKEEKRICQECVRRDAAWVVAKSTGPFYEMALCGACLERWRTEGEPITDVTHRG